MAPSGYSQLFEREFLKSDEGEGMKPECLVWSGLKRNSPEAKLQLLKIIIAVATMSVGLEALSTELGVPGYTKSIAKSFNDVPCKPGFQSADIAGYGYSSCCVIKKTPKVPYVVKRCSTCFGDDENVIGGKEENKGKVPQIELQIGNEDEDKKDKKDEDKKDEVEYEEVVDRNNCSN
ncbi:unnamed protein product [Mortierella alpina]